MDITDTRMEMSLPELELAESSIDVVEANFHGVLGTRQPYATDSGVESLVGCHALTCYS